jgi:alanine racemase
VSGGVGSYAGAPPEQAQALLTIDLDALVANWRMLSARAGAAECSAVVKADAYGVGLEPAARALAKAGCRTFFVAQPSEASRLRAALADVAGAQDARIFCLNGLLCEDAALAALLAANAIPVLGSPREFAFWTSRTDRPATIHVDTGMNRLGMSLDEARALAADPQAPRIDLVMSHFASSEVPDAPSNAAQIAAFEQARALFPMARASMANSSGIFLASAPHYDLVRPGYALYGGNPTPDAPNPMLPVARLQARVIQTREVEAGARVGYNSTWIAPGPRRLATIGVGYADGLLRSASGPAGKDGALVYAGAPGAQTPCPVVGRISMDLTVIDATDAPAPSVAPGAFVEILGRSAGVDDLAARAGTIGYEILTSLGRRYARVFLGG